MYLEFVCAKCQKKLKVREENLGSKVRCPYCHHAQVLETPSGTDVDVPFQINVNEPARGPGGSGPAGGSSAPDAGSRQDYADATQVSMIAGAGIGFGLFVAFYAIMFVLQSTWFGQLFLERGWVQFVMVFLLGWSVAILFLKSRKLAVQKNSMLFDLLPNEISKDITVKTVNQFVRHIRGLPVRHGESFLINRVLRGLEHFRVLRSNSEVAARLSSQSDIDANSVASSYTLLKVFIWAIPILGFIGTVIGISSAVGGFSGSLNSSADMDALKESLNSVTGGLSTAFDTTLVALVFSIMVMFPTTAMQKAEDDLLNGVDEYCNENLLKRLKDGHRDVPAASGVDPKALQAAIDAAMAPHHAELKTWSKKLDAMGDALGQQMAQRWSKADDQLQQRHQQTLKQMQQTMSALNGLSERLQELSSKQTEAMTSLANQTSDAQEGLSASMQNAAESLNGYFKALETGVDSLNGVLGRLGEQQVVIQTAAPAGRTGWSLFGRRNGRRNGH
ncbi:MAG: MotA/TolQ/ExbB proton channel family protein [Maioricimonas sp. JB049]